MKPYTRLYPSICAWENLESAYRRARTPFPSHSDGGALGEGKRGRAPAATFERQLEDNLVALQNDLAQQTYQPGAYHNFYIHEPKRRREHCTACVESRTGSGPGRASRLSREAGRIVKRLALRSSVNPARAAPC